MNHSVRFVIRNAKGTRSKDEQSRNETVPHTAPIRSTDSNFLDKQQLQPISERINILEGNLKILQKKYRENLKEGFENKIKAYRLEAVVERKLFKQAVSETKKMQELERLESKIQHNKRLRLFSQDRAYVNSFYQKEKERFIRQKKEQDKRKMSLTIRERQISESQQRKQSHDKIAWQEENSGRKKNYFDFLRKFSLRRQLVGTKKQMLTRMLTNTQKLRELKGQLEELQMFNENTFITL